MTLVAGAVIWAGYTLMWWGWLCVTNHKPDPDPGAHWPSMIDLVSPGRADRVDGLLHPKSSTPGP